MSNKGGNRSHEPEKERFRDAFSARLIERKKGAATAASVNPSTVWSWQQRGEAMPDIWQVKLIAKAKGVSPAWLAFQHGPRDEGAAASGFSLAAEIEKEPTLSELVSIFRYQPAQRPFMASMLQAIKQLPSGATVSVKAPEQPAKATPIAQGEAWQEMKRLVKGSKDFNVKSAGPVPKGPQITQPPSERRLAADVVPIASGAPYIAETEPTDVKYPLHPAPRRRTRNPTIFLAFSAPRESCPADPN